MSTRSFVSDKSYGNIQPARAVGLEPEIQQVCTVLKDTVIQRRGQQCVILGARATGKTLVIDKALQWFQSEYPNQAMIIRINGLSHSDDRLASREIAKQLDVALSRTEQKHHDLNVEPLIERPSMSQTLKAINQLFGNTAQVALDDPEEEYMRVIFVIEELDKYVSSHQVLVYELLDLSLTSTTGVSVIATSTRLNVLDLLEKRNRSRNFASCSSLGKPSSVDHLMEIGIELLRSPDGTDSNLVSLQELENICKEVWYTTNSIKNLQSHLLSYILDPEHAAESQQLMIPSTSSSLSKPIDSVPEMDWASLICAARAVLRYETDSVNLVLVSDEWRALVHTMHVNRFADLTARSQAANNRMMRPGSTPAALLAVKHSWERLRQMGLSEPTTGQSSQDDLKMYIPELNLDDLRGLLPTAYALYSWTKLET